VQGGDFMKNHSNLEDEHYLDVEKSVYDFQLAHTSDFKNNYAYRFFKRNISYQNSNKSIENIAKMLHDDKVGPKLKEGEVVAVISPMIPEVVSSFYGIAKNGATFFCIDPRTNATRIRDFLNLAEVRQAFVLDAAYGKLDAIIDQTYLENVIVISAIDSMFPALGFLYHHDQMKKTKEYYQTTEYLNTEDPSRVKELLKMYESKTSFTKEDEKMIKNLRVYEKTRDIAMKNLYYTNPPKSGYVPFKEAMVLSKYSPAFSSIYNPDVPASLTLTSGTTGKPKVVPTKHRSYNAKVRDYTYTTMPIEVGDRILSMPPFILYGEIFMHMAYVRGVQDVIIPDITAYYYPDVIRKEKISHAVGVPSQALTLSEDKQFNQHTASYLKSVSVGGTKMLKEHERKINRSLAPYGISITQGYSMTELTPATMTNMPGAIKEGSVGRVIGNAQALVVNLKTMEVLGPNQIGTLIVHSDEQFEGYYKNKKDSKEAFVTIGNTVYVNTGDEGYYDQDGYYFVTGRSKEMIIRPDGHNIFPSEMEELLVCHPYVEDCAVVGYPYPSYENPTGEYPKAHVVLKEEYRGNEVIIEEELRTYCLENLPERDVPYYYQFHDSLPLTPVLKPDKLELERMNEESYWEEKNQQKKLIK